jgi:hypothetical protein
MHIVLEGGNHRICDRRPRSWHDIAIGRQKFQFVEIALKQVADETDGAGCGVASAARTDRSETSGTQAPRPDLASPYRIGISAATPFAWRRAETERYSWRRPVAMQSRRVVLEGEMRRLLLGLIFAATSLCKAPAQDYLRASSSGRKRSVQAGSCCCSGIAVTGPSLQPNGAEDCLTRPVPKSPLQENCSAPEFQGTGRGPAPIARESKPDLLPQEL